MRMANQRWRSVGRFPNDGGSCWVVIRPFNGISAGYDIAWFDVIKQITNYRWSTARQYKHIIIRQTAPLNSAHDKRLGLCIAATMRTDALLYGFLQKRCTARISLWFGSLPRNVTGAAPCKVIRLPWCGRPTFEPLLSWNQHGRAQCLARLNDFMSFNSIFERIFIVYVGFE